MGFVKSSEDILNRHRDSVDFFDLQRLTLVWETRADIVAKLLPPPLKPTARPIAVAFIANYPRTSLGITYREAALLLRAEFNGEPGSYCLSMPVTDDMAMALGREVAGFPKKIGDIKLERNGAKVEGWAERHGVRFCELRGNLNGTFNTPDASDVFQDLAAQRVAIVFNFKHSPSADSPGFDYRPQLVRQEVVMNPSSIEIGEGEITLRHSDVDPWTEVEVVRMLGAVYTTANASMTKRAIVAQVEPLTFAPYAFLKWDF